MEKECLSACVSLPERLKRTPSMCSYSLLSSIAADKGNVAHSTPNTASQTTIAAILLLGNNHYTCCFT